MCVSRPKIEKAAPPPKRSTDEPDLDVANPEDEDLRRQQQALGIDQLRIERANPAASLPEKGAGLQLSR